jgi:hypothetical protein
VNVNGEPGDCAILRARSGDWAPVWHFQKDGTLKLPGAGAGPAVLGAWYSIAWDNQPRWVKLSMRVKRTRIRKATEDDSWAENEEADRKARRLDVTVEWHGVLELVDDQLTICLREARSRETTFAAGPGKLVLVYKRVQP